MDKEMDEAQLSHRRVVMNPRLDYPAAAPASPIAGPVWVCITDVLYDTALYNRLLIRESRANRVNAAEYRHVSQCVVVVVGRNVAWINDTSRLGPLLRPVPLPITSRPTASS